MYEYTYNTTVNEKKYKVKIGLEAILQIEDFWNFEKVEDFIDGRFKEGKISADYLVFKCGNFTEYVTSIVEAFEERNVLDRLNEIVFIPELYEDSCYLQIEILTDGWYDKYLLAVILNDIKKNDLESIVLESYTFDDDANVELKIQTNSDILYSVWDNYIEFKNYLVKEEEK
jgi:hypothetical protein